MKYASLLLNATLLFALIVQTGSAMRSRSTANRAMDQTERAVAACKEWERLFHEMEDIADERGHMLGISRATGPVTGEE